MESSRKVLFFLVLASFCLAQAIATNFIDKNSKLEDFAEPGWFLENIPFIDIPDKEVEQVYYYRWSSHKRHLRYTTPGVGYTVTEFVHDVGYSAKFGTLNDAAGHHIYESRWLRDTRYAEDYINFWAREGGANQQYSEWIADAAYAIFLVSGNKEFIASQQEGLVENFNGWRPHFEPRLNLYFISPLYDAMEHSASSEQTDDGFGGGVGYRPSFNAELYGNAVAIAKIARLNNDTVTADEFEARARAIRMGILESLWDDQRIFFFHMFRENNPTDDLLDSRENIGFFPWRFGVPDDDPKYERAWQHLFDPRGFNSTYGPTTCEQRSPWFDGNQTSQCCWWNGNSWPYSTGVILNSLAAQIKRYRTTEWANEHLYYDILGKYARTQYQDGKPYVGECHSPFRKLWVCDARNHSEHYAHSTFVDNVLGEWLGVEPQPDNTLVINPLIGNWYDRFALENLQYHGHDVSVVWDVDGSHYNVDPGLTVFVNGREVGHAMDIPSGGLRVDVPPPRVDEEFRRKKVENYAANVNGFGWPKVDASFTSVNDASTWQAVDGRIFYDFVPSNRWMNFGGPSEKDWFSVDFGPGRRRRLSEVKVYLYSDVATELGNVDCPVDIRVEVQTEAGEWVETDDQAARPPMAECVQNDVQTIYFEAVTTQKLRLVFWRNTEANWFVGMTELEIWAPWPQVPDEEPGVYEAEDGYITRAEMLAAGSASGGSYVGRIDDPEASVEFSGVWVDQAGQYEVRVYYANGIPEEASMLVTANNVHRQTAIFPPTRNEWGQFDSSTFITLTLPLLRGNNVIIFKNGENFAELDKIKVLGV